MDTTNKYIDAVNKKYQELQTYSTTYNVKAKSQREKLMSEHKEAFKKDPTSVDINTIAKNMFYLNGFYQADIRRLQTQLLDLYSMVKDINPEAEFPVEVENTVKVLKSSLPGIVFIVEEGEFKEIEKGKVDKITKDFEDKGYYKLFEDQVKTLLNA